MNSPTHFKEFRPVFAVADLKRALAHYAELGFATKAFADGDEYGFAERDGIGLHLTAETDSAHLVGTGVAFLYVEDADALGEEWDRPGIGGTNRPVELMPYGFREGAHSDLDNNVIRYGSLPRTEGS